MPGLQLFWSSETVGEPSIPVWTATLIRVGENNEPTDSGEWREIFGSLEATKAFQRGIEAASAMLLAKFPVPNIPRTDTWR